MVATSPLSPTLAQFGTRVTSQLEKPDVSLAWAAEMCVHRAGRAGALLRAGTGLDPCAACMQSWWMDAHTAGNKSKAGLALLHAPSQAFKCDSHLLKLSFCAAHGA